MNRQDFRDWKSSPISHAMFNEIDRRIEGLKDELSYGAGADPRSDAIKVGAIQALRDIIEVDWFEETEDD